MKILIGQEHNLLPGWACRSNVCCENCMSGFFYFVLNLSKSVSTFFRSMPKANCFFSSASLSLVHKLKVMTAVELHVNATYYTRNPLLKSVYEKSQSVMGGKLFSLSSHYIIGRSAKIEIFSKLSDLQTF